MHRVNRSAAIIKPKGPFVKWANWAYRISGDDREYSADYFQKDCSIVLIPEYSSTKEAKVYISMSWKAIFEAELRKWLVEPSLWPKDMSKELFWQWFAVKYQSDVFDSE